MYLATSFHICIHSWYERNVRAGKTRMWHSVIKRKIYSGDSRNLTEILSFLRFFFHDDRPAKSNCWLKILILIIIIVRSHSSLTYLQNFISNLSLTSLRITQFDNHSIKIMAAHQKTKFVNFLKRYLSSVKLENYLVYGRTECCQYSGEQRCNKDTAISRHDCIEVEYETTLDQFPQ